MRLAAARTMALRFPRVAENASNTSPDPGWACSNPNSGASAADGMLRTDGMETEVGTIASRESRDDRSRPSVEVSYTLSEDAPARAKWPLQPEDIREADLGSQSARLLSVDDKGGRIENEEFSPARRACP